MQLMLGPEPPRFEIATVAAAPPMVHMTVSGEVDLATAPVLLSALLKAIEEHHPRTLELDLAQVTFLDAQGVSALLRAHHAARAVSSAVRLVRPQRHVRRVLELTGVATVCDIVD
jgi:anti-sigma B factor antagonist